VGVNPYLKNPAPPPPRRPYTLRLRNTGETFRVDPAALPDEEGQRGSVLTVLLDGGVRIDHSCGGVLACSTCHIYVHAGAASAPEATDDELDMLDLAPALRSNSRLACQCVPDGSCDVEVEIPAWKRNEVSEGH
jgi:2Fe-2S ferredoxin